MLRMKVFERFSKQTPRRVSNFVLSTPCPTVYRITWCSFGNLSNTAILPVYQINLTCYTFKKYILARMKSYVITGEPASKLERNTDVIAWLHIQECIAKRVRKFLLINLSVLKNQFPCQAYTL